MERAAAFCRAHDLPWDQARAERLGAYVALLLKFNESMNLIGPMGAQEVVDSLIIDSLTAAAVCPPAGSVLDIGSGAGLPGVPLSIVFPEVETTLVEPRQKRTTFLKIAKRQLGLDNVHIERCRIEELADARYDYVISKAFQPPADWLRTAAQWVRAPCGVVVSLRSTGDDAGVEEALAEAKLELVASAPDVDALDAPVGGRGVFVYRRNV